MRLNEYGKIVYREWFRSAEMRRELELYGDEFVVMPNHIHGIVWLVEPGGTVDGVGAHGRVGSHRRAPLRQYYGH